MTREDERYRSCECCKLNGICNKSFLECREHMREQDSQRTRETIKYMMVPVCMVIMAIVFLAYMIVSMLIGFNIYFSVIALATELLTIFCIPRQKEIVVPKDNHINAHTTSI